MRDDLEKLHHFVARFARAHDGNADGLFREVGLILYPLSVLETGYTSTPRGSVTFATTGGDGVHFGLMRVDGEITSASPVVMTVPMNWDSPNLVVGANLSEFLSLGSHFGYGDLEQLTYQREQTIREIEAANGIAFEDLPEGGAILAALTREFELQPWPEHAARLAELERAYRHVLENADAG